jgi:uncharacterized protein YbjT (DUF2867 family)
MSNVFIIGVIGGVCFRLGPILIAAGHTVSGLHHKPEQADDLRDAGIKPYLGDIMEMTTDELIKAVCGIDVTAFSVGTAGSGLNRTAS